MGIESLHDVRRAEVSAIILSCAKVEMEDMPELAGVLESLLQILQNTSLKTDARRRAMVCLRDAAESLRERALSLHAYADMLATEHPDG